METKKNLRAGLLRAAAGVFCLLAARMASASDTMQAASGFVETSGVLVSPASGEPRLMTKAALSRGSYRLTAEYKTEGFGASEKFVLEAKTPERVALSSSEWVGAAPEWAPLVLYFQVTEPSRVMVRFCNWPPGLANAKLLLRTVDISPFAFTQENALIDGGFDGGQPGFVPPNWLLKNELKNAAAGTLASNMTYRSGRLLLRMAGDGVKPCILQYRSFPLPNKGELVFSVWARADHPLPLTMHLIQEGWAKRAERSHLLTPAWQKYEVAWPVPDAGEKNRFFLRLDSSTNSAPIEIADARLIWRAESEAGAVDPYQAARAAGWQGVPGRNLILNPDFELGGTGYFYDFSWPKKYEDYASIRGAQPIELLAGRGVDGGTCAWVRGTSLRPYCFPVKVGETYTLSAELRAPEGETNAVCRVWAFDSEWKCALGQSVSGISGAALKRYSWSFVWKPENIQKRGYVRFDSAGVLVDRIQVAVGDQAAAYEAPPVMLGLVCDRWPYFVRGRDVPRVTLKAVPGVRRTGRATVCATASDAWGRSVWTKTFDAPLDRETRVPVDCPDRLGVFHVELTAEVDGRVAGIGIGRYAVLDPPPPQSGSAGLGGICQESFNFPVWLCEDHARIQTDLGIRYNRFFASVPSDLPEPLPIEWAADLKAKCKPFNRAGIELVPCVGPLSDAAAQNAQTLERPGPQELASFETHLRAYVGALKEEITYWEIFNEPNLWRVPRGPNAGKRTLYPAKYVDYQKVAYQTIKTIDPKLRVVCNALNNVDFDWINDWMAAGGARDMDVFSFHPYGLTDFFETGTRLEKTLHGLGFDGPLLNSEKYYGANVFYDRAGYEETKRDYYLPHDGECKTAGRSIQHFISSAAVGVPVCFFNPTGTLSRRGPGSALFLYDFFGAYSAAIRWMAEAGRGERVEVGPTVSAYLFFHAKKGPFAVVWSPLLKADGGLRLTGDFIPYDMMGNRLAAEACANGVPLATEPVYLQFKQGTSAEAIRSALTSAEVVGMGAPVRVEAAVTGPKRFSVSVASQRNKPVDGAVRILSLPEGWRVASSPRAFSGLPAGKTVRMDVDLVEGVIQNRGEYPLSVVAECGDEFARRDIILRPLFVQRMDRVTADGKLDEWQGAAWVELGADQRSRDFNPALPYRGASDLSARVAVGWNPEALAVAVVVTDDREQSAESPALGWQGDSVQIFLDPKNDAAEDDPHSADDIDYLLTRIGGVSRAWLVKGAEGHFRGESNKVDGFQDVDAQVCVTRQGTQTVYELVLPSRTCLPGVDLTAGGGCGFSLMINDNDGQGRKTGLTLAPRGSEPYGSPQLYCDAVFLDGGTKKSTNTAGR